MVVQQIGLGCKSSKKSHSAKAAHFSNANAVYLFLSVPPSPSPSIGEQW